MKTLKFQALGVACSLTVSSLPKAAAKFATVRAANAAEKTAIPFDAQAFVSRLRQSEVMRLRLPAGDASDIRVVKPSSARGARRAESAAARPVVSGAMTFLTPTVIVEGYHTDDMKAARAAGARLLTESYEGKALLGVDSVDQVPALVALLAKREVGSVSPNFLRRFAPTPRSTQAKDWAYAKIGLSDAWKITKGTPEISVAVLDEGVDTSHPALKPAVVGEQDFIGGKGSSAMPDGNDAHGTACAGTIVSRNPAAIGMAPKCSLLAARIAMGDGSGNWVFDDFATADAIDWSWRNGASVLSNSWGGGPPSDAISRAFGRARTQGRGGKGAIVCIAAGNHQLPIDFPGNLPGYVTVGASTPNDERKTRTSSDGENWWGTGYGPALWLLAPGVFIHTTDISGPAGYEGGDYTATFNGTSSATPHVAAAVALMLSINPNLSAGDVRMLLAKTAKPIEGQTGRTDELGYGRLDVGAAVAAAKMHS